MAWTFENGGLAAGNVGSAPTYKDVTFDFMGQKYFKPGEYDPALATTLNAGNQGGWQTGLDAFLQHGQDEGGTDPLSQAAATGYKTADLRGLASNFGIDSTGMDNAALTQALADRTKGYSAIRGLSEGWNPTGDPRGANYTLYESKDGKLVPIQTSGYHAKEQGSYLQEHPGILAPLAVASAGLAYGALGAGAGAGGGAAASGAGAAGAGGAGTAGISGSIANALGLGGWWGGLPAWGQGAITGSLMGGGQAGLTGGNILKGALMGGLTGGLGAYAGPALSNLTGLPSWASRGLVSAGLGGLTGGWKGALAGGLGSLATTGLGAAGLPGGAASYLGGLAGRMGAGALAGGGGGASGAGGAGGAGGGGGGGMAGGGVGGASSSAGGAGRGLSGGWKSVVPALDAAYQQRAYAPVLAEENRARLAKQLATENEWA